MSEMGLVPLEEHDQKAISEILDKYPGNPIVPMLKSIIQSGEYTEGISEHFTPDMWAQQLMQWAMNDPKARLIDRTKAWAEAAKFYGQYPTESPKGNQMNVQFVMKNPQNIKDIDAKIKSTGTDA